MPKVSICIPTLDNDLKLYQTLCSIRKHTSHIDYEVVVIDNGSVPRGYIAPQNRALAAASPDSDILIALNDDVLVGPGWIEPFIRHIDNGGYVCFPDQTATDGLQRICGWCIVFSRKAYEELGGFDSRFDLWCGDIDLIKRCANKGKPVVRIALPQPLVHLDGGTNTIGNQDYRSYMDPTGQQDIQKYFLKWGSSPNEDKFLQGDDPWYDWTKA